MSLTKEKKDIQSFILIFVLFFLIIIILDWVLFNRLWLPKQESILYQPLFYFYENFNSKMIFIRLAYCFSVGFLAWFTPSLKFGRKLEKENVTKYLFIAIILGGAILFGYLGYEIYDLIIFPALLLLFIYPTALYFSKQNNSLIEENMLDGVSSEEENEISFSFKTNKGKLVVHSPQQGIWVEGGAGSGKSASLIEPFIHQAIEKGFAGVVYDYKGNPPTLALTAYNALYNTKTNTKTKFAMINFSLLEQSVRCNPIAPRYLRTQLHASEAADIIMKNLNKEWIKKTDFWAENAISILKATIWFLRNNHPEYCTLPHAISFILNDYEKFMDVLCTDNDAAIMMQPITIAHKKEAAGQIAGAISSIQLPLTKLRNKEIFWVLGKDDFDLNITNSSKPIMLTICNDPEIEESLSPGISLILSVCMQQMNQQGKNKSIFCIDELPTVYIKKLDKLPATARSNKVCTMLGVQDYSQLERDYSREEAKVIISNLGNQFIGMTNSKETAERVSQVFGKIKKMKVSYSTSESSFSQSDTLQEESVLQSRDVAGQGIGHFTGKIAGGKPPFFSAQFPYFDKEKIYSKYVSKIPDFALVTNTGDENMDKQIFQNQVDANFVRINQEITNLINSYLDKP
ncbi:MAG: hypothetical protein CVT95_08500 [Bacteroidetes bacterium HGW-Bacteroidetes-12]|nr:MAG: hypothetical protein CVT95_08500 [Bacteroidetes bacterium HGW-Bacteroidetes-12]